MNDKLMCIIGHARAGSTLLAGLLNLHSFVNTVYNIDKSKSQKFIDQLLTQPMHAKYGEALEDKGFWFSIFPGKNIYKHVGKEMIVEESSVPEDKIEEIRKHVLRTYSGKGKFLIKAPSHSFRVLALRKIFPEMKFLVLYRDAKQCVSSWAKDNYSIGNIRKLCEKWNEVVDYIEYVKDITSMATITYDQLIEEKEDTLRKVHQYFGLHYEPLTEVTLTDRREKYKDKLSKEALTCVEEITKQNLEYIRRIQRL